MSMLMLMNVWVNVSLLIISIQLCGGLSVKYPTSSVKQTHKGISTLYRKVSPSNVVMHIKQTGNRSRRIGNKGKNHEKRKKKIQILPLEKIDSKIMCCKDEAYSKAPTGSSHRMLEGPPKKVQLPNLTKLLKMMTTSKTSMLPIFPMLYYITSRGGKTGGRGKSRRGSEPRGSRSNRSVTVQMTLAPKGSIHEKRTKEILEDPVKNYPWEISIPFHETITRELSPYYNFLKCEWAYLDYKRDSRKACGKIEGGLENYEGKGLKLEKGVDRPRYKEMPYYLDHGVEWRNFNHDEMIQFDIDPDGNQDQTFLETEEDLEYRQWGNWNYNCAKETTQLNTAWRDPVLSKNLTNLIYPWNHKAHENHIIPYGFPSPTFFIPEPKIEWELAARGFFGGYYEDPNWNRIKQYKIMKKLILEWHECKKDDPRIAAIKTELFGISSRKKYPSKQIKLINEHALLRAKEILLDHILDPNNDPDYITYFLDRAEPIDYIGGGNHKCPQEEIRNKTIVLNMCVYSNKQQQESYSYNMSIPEMAEMYHYYMTEIRGEGRAHQSCEDPVEDKYQCYELQNERKKFSALFALYKPLWSNKKFGEEFGDALREGEKLHINKFNKFNHILKLKKKKKLTQEEVNQCNYVDDYGHVDDQYDV
ncbi:conserved Plasmodium protein, unknown function [Plasmodium malariae]|uniref:Uncharacterized protein n=1 Tax=Plasmodium malariae TaxID=5858 RepID=A0A1C3KY34_PLAMA|nr:conserved Plasmodium protein, unknown function [Plasmodium malariae]